MNQFETFINESKSLLFNYLQQNLNLRNSDIQKIYPNFFNEIHFKNNSNSDLEKINILYNSLISKKDKKNLGAFYTSDKELIKHMMDNVNILSGKILEPSCGAGSFLTQIAEEIIVQLTTNGYKPHEIIDYLTENLYGNDIDQYACLITEINLLKTIVPLICDTIKTNPSYTIRKTFHLSTNDFTKIYTPNYFDLIIGNPPFVTLYGKMSRNMTEEKRMYYNTFDFVQDKKKNNKFNTCMFFIENSIKSLKPNGKLSFILDISFFETAFIDTRKYILENCFIDKITSGIKAFDCASGQLVLTLTNIKKFNPNTIWYDYNTKECFNISQSIWYNPTNNYKIFKSLNNEEDTIINSFVDFPTLLEIFPNKSLRTCCALTGKTDDFLVDNQNNQNFDVFPYLEGSLGIPYQFCEPQTNKFIKYDYELQLKISNDFKVELEKLGIKNKKRVTLGDKNAYLSPKIFIRQSAKKIIATYTDKPYAANNSIYILTNKKNDFENIDLLKYVVAILNSNAISFFARVKNIIRTGIGKIPQIKISDLKTLKIPLCTKYYQEIINISNNLLQNCDFNNNFKKLNMLVYKILKLKSNQIEYIEEYLKRNC